MAAAAAVLMLSRMGWGEAWGGRSWVRRSWAQRMAMLAVRIRTRAAGAGIT